MSMRDNLFRELLTNLGKLDRSFLLFASGLTGSNGAHLGRLRSIRARVGQIQFLDPLASKKLDGGDRHFP